VGEWEERTSDWASASSLREREVCLLAQEGG